MSKIVEFNPNKRDTIKKFETMKQIMDKVDPEKITEMLVFIKTTDEDTGNAVWAYGPTWAMIGQLSVFLEELKLELYAEDFLDSEDEDELQ